MKYQVYPPMEIGLLTGPARTSITDPDAVTVTEWTWRVLSAGLRNLLIDMSLCGENSISTCRRVLRLIAQDVLCRIVDVLLWVGF